ncbi:MAG: DNA repair protein RecN, partial [Taibaiella sp.]|nr:DNA repair protein RecN [Taibaiella sp.]
KILQILGGARQLLEEGEQPLTNELKRINQQLQGIIDIVPAIKPLQERIASAWAELKDVADELSAEEAKVSLDPEVMEQQQQRMDAGYKLMKKHAVNTTAELLLLQARLEEELKLTLDVNSAIERLGKEEEILYKELLAEGEKLSAGRRRAIPAFAKRMNELLVLVGMPNARFDVGMEHAVPAISGTDSIQFLIDANKSGQLLPLQKAASGGEMSRIMLCIKSLTAKALHLPTLIFDEVDTGISGEAARQVAVLLRALSEYHQVICITHQPQVAAKGYRHFYVYKQADKTGKLATHVRTLEQSERVLAIAQMIGGERPSEAAMINARELVEI